MPYFLWQPKLLLIVNYYWYVKKYIFLIFDFNKKFMPICNALISAKFLD